MHLSERTLILIIDINYSTFVCFFSFGQGINDDALIGLYLFICISIYKILSKVHPDAVFVNIAAVFLILDKKVIISFI